MIERVIPGVSSLAGYNSSKFAGDFNAGIMVAILFIPQCMAYAMIAGVPPVIGLYAGTLPLIVYSLFGTSRHLSVGPVSIVSLLAFSGVSSIAEPGTSSFIEFVILLGLIVGLIQVFMGMINIGPLFDHISHAVIRGFTISVSMIIAFNQIDTLLGLSLPSYQNPLLSLVGILRNLTEVTPHSLALGLISIVTLILLKRILPFSIGPFVVIIIATFIVYYFQLQSKGVNIVGGIPKGLPDLTFPNVSLEVLQVLIPSALGIASISFLESYAVARAIAEKEQYKIDTNKELMGLGLSNISSSFIGSIPVAGAFSRTAVNYKGGASTNVSSILSAIIIIVSLMFLTPLFFYLPTASLAAIIIVSVLSLIDISQINEYGRTRSVESMVFFVTLLVTLIVDIFVGLLIGILLSALFSLLRKHFFYYT